VYNRGKSGEAGPNKEHSGEARLQEEDGREEEKEKRNHRHRDSQEQKQRGGGWQ